MAVPYSPWSNPGAQYAPEDNSATVAYAEGYDTAEDVGESADHEAAGGGHMAMMAEALSIMNEQQQLIKELTAQLTDRQDV